MDHQYIHPNGSQDQTDLQHCGGDRANHLATQGIWPVHLSDEC